MTWAKRRSAVGCGLAALAALAALAVLVPEVCRAQSPLRVMSFNVRYGTANDGAHAWPHRSEAVVGTIADHAPHLLGVQEALRFQLDEIGAALGRYRLIGVGRDDGRTAGEHAAILADTSRFTVLAEGTFWLSETPEVPGSMHWGNRITRITTWARLVDRATADTIRVYNAHWDHESQASRERSAELLLARIVRDGSRSDAVLVMGDFNADARNPAIRALLTDQRIQLADAHTVSAPAADWGGTFHGFRGDSRGERIDAILLGPGWTVKEAGVDRRRWGPVWASDHFAVWAWLDRR